MTKSGKSDLITHDSIEIYHINIEVNEQQGYTLVSADKRLPSSNNSLKLGLFGPITWSYGPVLATEWHQNEPYNNGCPHASCYQTTNGRQLAGCGAIAVAQILYHFRAYLPWTAPGYENYNYDELNRWVNFKFYSKLNPDNNAHNY